MLKERVCFIFLECTNKNHLLYMPTCIHNYISHNGQIPTRKNIYISGFRIY